MDLKDRLASILPGSHQIDMLIRKGSMKPSDDSPFSNEIFDPTGQSHFSPTPGSSSHSLPPTATDAHFFQPSQASRDAIRREYKDTNYGVVNPRTLDNVSPFALLLSLPLHLRATDVLQSFSSMRLSMIKSSMLPSLTDLLPVPYLPSQSSTFTPIRASYQPTAPPTLLHRVLSPSPYNTYIPVLSPRNSTTSSSLLQVTSDPPGPPSSVLPI